MRYKIAAALLLFICSAVLVLAGAGFACYALYAAFVPLVGNAYAAAIAAAILLLAPSLGLVLLSLRARKGRIRNLEQAAAGQSPFTPSPDNIALGFLAGLARDKPITAVLLAGIFGAAASLFRDKK
jgi:high-affinity Fe2+/Pb2+ permease